MDTKPYRVLSILIFVLVSSSIHGAGTSPFDAGPFADDDAGSGADAPDLAPLALPIRTERVYEGSVRAPDDRWDWYRIDVAGDHVHVLLEALTACLRIEQAGRVLAEGCAAADTGASVWGFTDAGAPLEIGVERGAAESYRLSVGVDTWAEGADARPMEGEEEGRDAPDIPVALAGLDAGTSRQGRVGVVLNDVYDWYLIAAPRGADVVVTIDGLGAGCLHLLDATAAREEATCVFTSDQGRTVLQGRVGDEPLYLGVGGWALTYGLHVEW